MEAGHYIGKGGQTYHWQRSECFGGWMVHDITGAMRGMKTEDIDVAKAALDALLAEPEWVRIPARVSEVPMRISRSGEIAQEYYAGDGWLSDMRDDAAECWIWPEAYRAGRATGLEDGRKEARESAEYVLELDEEMGRHGPRGIVAVDSSVWDELMTLALKVLGQ
jgi:hypothetical protein